MGQGGHEERTGGDAEEAPIDLGGVGDVFREGVEGVDAEEHTDADKHGRDGEDLNGGVEIVADVDGDEGAEAAHDEHGGGEGEDDEGEGGVVKDEAAALLHVGEDFAERGGLGGGRIDGLGGFG